MVKLPRPPAALLLSRIVRLICDAVHAVHADEAGLNDFLLRTAGHGDVGVSFGLAVPADRGTADGERVWVTSQSAPYPPAVLDDELWHGDDVGGPSLGAWGGDGDGDYCSVAARDVETGEVIWRVDACSGGRSSDCSLASPKNVWFVPRHATLGSSTRPTVYSLDDAGILRGYSSGDGQLVLDTDLVGGIDANVDNSWIFPGGIPRLLDAQSAIGTVISREGGGADESLALVNPGTGQPIKEEGYHRQQTSASTLLSARELLQRARVSSKRQYGRARVVDMHALDGLSPRVSIWVAWSNDDDRGRAVSTFASMALVEAALTTKASGGGPVVTVYRIARAAPLNLADSASIANVAFLLSSLRMVHHGDGIVSLLAISSTSSQLLINMIDVTSSKSKFGQLVEVNALHLHWRSIVSIHVDSTKDEAGVDILAGEGSLFHVVRLAGMDVRYPVSQGRKEGLFLLNDKGGGDGLSFHRVYSPSESDEEIRQDALAYCADIRVVVAASQDEEGKTVASAFHIDPSLWQSVRRISLSPPVMLEGDAVIVSSLQGGGNESPGLVEHAHLVECSGDGMTVVFTALGGMTTAFRFEPKSTSIGVRRLWFAEEALGSVSSAIFLDETHAFADAGVVGVVDEEDEKALRDLQFLNRIQSQLSSFSSFVLGGGALSSLTSLVLPSSGEKKVERDVAFGLAKISVMLSERLHRIVAMNTARNGEVVWSTGLHPGAGWHRLVRGGQFAGLNDPRGNMGVHDHEVLALSYVGGGNHDGSVEWMCLDGVSGRVLSSGQIATPGPVVQVAPLRGAPHAHHHREGGGCRQMALLVHASRTEAGVVPDTARSRAVADEVISAAEPNGFFVHTVDRGTGEFVALRLSRRPGSRLGLGSDLFELTTVGTTVFDPVQERIINVAYPRRGEAVQSPSTVLGDDSLLLKYLNPHLVAVVTEATPEFLSSVAGGEDGGDLGGGRFYNALVGGGQYSGTTASAGQKRRPLGVGKASVVEDQASTNEPPPSLFVSLVDSVSGQILHRVSHAHALDPDASSAAEGPTRVPVIISENWVVYALPNRRTRRTDVGVLTLHEGMIDRNSLTVFSSPDQEPEFSSLESAGPIVLSKTYGVSKPVTALGATATRAGISPRQFLLATGNGQVISVDRRMLDPRRPSGELKEGEKAEGLARYLPLIPMMPQRTTSHEYDVSSVRHVSSASANVESQSLMLAYGGPDVFFARLAPSKGFDLLPDDFNKGLLMAVLSGLVVLLNVIQRMNKKKMVETAWS